MSIGRLYFLFGEMPIQVFCPKPSALNVIIDMVAFKSIMFLLFSLCPLFCSSGLLPCPSRPPPCLFWVLFAYFLVFYFNFSRGVLAPYLPVIFFSGCSRDYNTSLTSHSLLRANIASLPINYRTEGPFTLTPSVHVC